MLAAVLITTLVGLSAAIPPARTHTKRIDVPAPKPRVVHKPALQEHAVKRVQPVHYERTVVKEINVPKPFVQEVPIHVEKTIVLKQPHIRRVPIHIRKEVIEPHVKHVPEVKVHYRERPYVVWHTRNVKKDVPVPRRVDIIRPKVVTKVLNRIVEVPQKFVQHRVKTVRVPRPYKVTQVRRKYVDVPVHVKVPEPRISVQHTQEVRPVPMPVDVVQKVGIRKRVTVKEVVPVPVQARSSVSTSVVDTVVGGGTVVDEVVGGVRGGGAVVGSLDISGSSGGTVVDRVVGGGAVDVSGPVIGEVDVVGRRGPVIGGVDVVGRRRSDVVVGAPFGGVVSGAVLGDDPLGVAGGTGGVIIGDGGIDYTGAAVDGDIAGSFGRTGSISVARGGRGGIDYTAAAVDGDIIAPEGRGGIDYTARGGRGGIDYTARGGRGGIDYTGAVVDGDIIGSIGRGGSFSVAGRGAGSGFVRGQVTGRFVDGTRRGGYGPNIGPGYGDGGDGGIYSDLQLAGNLANAADNTYDNDEYF